MNTNESPKQVFIDITYELHELLEYIIVHTDNFSNHDVSIDLKEKSNIVKIDTMPIKTFGRCYAIQLGKEIVSQGVHAIDFLSNMNLYVYFHHPGQFLSIDTKSKLYTLKGRNHFMDMTYSIMKNTLRSESTIPCSGDTNFGILLSFDWLESSLEKILAICSCCICCRYCVWGILKGKGCDFPYIWR